jgi:hypothetical protein
MKLHYLLAGIAASALMAGAAQAQLGGGTSPDTGVTPNQPVPADPAQSQTGVPSVDSTRPTGADAGQTNLPAGEVSGSTGSMSSSPTGVDASATVGGEAVNPDISTPDASATDTTAEAPSATSAGVNASANVQVVTNGPVPDTEENRAKYGEPMSRAGKRTEAAGN